MNILWRFRTHNALYNQVKELQSALERMEEELDLQIEKLQDENEYLKDELSYSRVRSNRLDEEIKTVRERDYKDIYPGLQAENKMLQDKIKELEEKLSLSVNKYNTALDDIFCSRCEVCTEEEGICPREDWVNEVQPETTSEDS